MTRTNKFLHEDGSVNMTNASASAHRARRETVLAGFRTSQKALRRVLSTIGLIPASR